MRMEKKKGGMENLQARTYDSSFLRTFLECPYRSYLRYIKRWVLIEEPEGRAFGAAFHEALDVYYEEGKTLTDAITTLRENLPAQVGDPTKSREHGELLLQEYFKKWGKDPWIIRDKEVEFQVDMPNERIFSGRIDLIIESSTGIYVVDHKTSRSVSSQFIKEYDPPNLQMEGYAYACIELVGECRGVIINGISTAKNPSDRFCRIVPPRKPEIYPIIFKESVDRFESYAAQNYFPKNLASCNHYGGCPFRDTCVYGEKKEILAMKFKQEKFDARPDSR